MRETRDLKGLYILNKELVQNKLKKADNPISKDGQVLNRHFIKEAVQMATNNEEALNFISHQEIQITTT